MSWETWGDGGFSGVDRGASKGCALGRGGDRGLVWHDEAWADGLGLLEGQCGTVLDVDTWWELVVTLTVGKGSVGGVGGAGHVVTAADQIEDVLAEIRAGDGWVANLDTEDVGTNKVAPVLSLNGNTFAAGQRVGPNNPTEGVSGQVSTVGIQFTSTITGVKVDTPLIELASYLDVAWSTHELDVPQGTSWDDAGSVAGFCAIGNNGGFNIANKAGVVQSG